jgi:ribonuclease Z
MLQLLQCSGILVRLHDGAAPPGQELTGEYVLLDVGEGCVGRLALLASVYHRDQAGNECKRACYHKLLLGLRFIWVSHMHADHHTGLLSLLSHRADALSCAHCCKRAYPPLDVVGPPALKELLSVYHDIIAAAASTPPATAPRYTVAGGPAPLPRMCGLLTLVSVRVDHCRDSFGAILTLTCPDADPGRRTILIYSGDTRPCLALVEAAAYAARTSGGECYVVLVH